MRYLMGSGLAVLVAMMVFGVAYGPNLLDSGRRDCERAVELHQTYLSINEEQSRNIEKHLLASYEHIETAITAATVNWEQVGRNTDAVRGLQTDVNILKEQINLLAELMTPAGPDKDPTETNGGSSGQ